MGLPVMDLDQDPTDPMGLGNLMAMATATVTATVSPALEAPGRIIP